MQILGDSTSLSSNVRDDGTIMTLEVIETLLTVQDVAGAVLLNAAGLAGKIVAMALGGQETSLVTAQLLCVLSRLCAADTAGLLGLLGRLDAGGKGDLLGNFVDLCVERMDNLMLPRKRRVVAVAMANLIGTGQETIIKRLGDVINLVVEVMHQERRDELLPAQALTAAQVHNY